jgi:DNA-binding transcriptional regulator PaaX
MARIRGTASQEILRMLFEGTAFVIAAQSPLFWLRVYKHWFSGKSLRESQVRDAFSYLRRKRLIVIEKSNHQIYIRLTSEGEKHAGKFQINKLVIAVPQGWDGVWRLIIFDIPEKLKVKREAFRGKLKELGFYPLQKSIWAYPYPCEKEVMLLREFFNLQPRHIRILEVQKLEEDRFLREYFGLKEKEVK